MTTLTKNEIVDQLRRLGINTINELESYMMEYNEYCSECSGQHSYGN